MANDRDYHVTVCASCGKASCWHAIFPCDNYLTANTMDVLASELRKAKREHEDYYSVAALTNTCGAVRYA